MRMLDWAKREVDIACKKECPDNEDGHWDYGCACYQSALKAFESLCQDEHSGLSIQFTKNILDRLIEGKCLTPICDEDFDIKTEFDVLQDEKYLDAHNMVSNKQCPRMSSLFRTEYKDGKIVYTDVNRVVCEDCNKPGILFGYGRAKEFIDELFPITMPYMPSVEPYKVVIEQFSLDPRLGDWDTEAWYEIIKPDGEHIPINKFYKYVLEDDKEITLEITKEEFNERKQNQWLIQRA